MDGFDRLDAAVRRAGRHAQPGPHCVHRLVVRRGAALGTQGTKRPLEVAVRLDVHRMLTKHHVVRPAVKIVIIAGVIDHMLVQRAARGDIDHLAAPADRQHRNVVHQRVAGELQSSASRAALKP